MVSWFCCKKMLRVLPVVSQEMCDLPTELERSRKTSGEWRQHCESAALVLCYKGEGLGKKELVCLASVNEKNNWFWVFNRQTVWKISLINYLQSGHIHTHTEAAIIYFILHSFINDLSPWHLNLVISFLNPPSSFPLVFLYPLTPSLPVPLSLPLLVPVPRIEIADVSQTFSHTGQRTTGPGMISGQDAAFSFLFQNHYERIGREITNHIVPNAFFISSIFP